MSGIDRRGKGGYYKRSVGGEYKGIGVCYVGEDGRKGGGDTSPTIIVTMVVILVLDWF